MNFVFRYLSVICFIVIMFATEACVWQTKVEPRQSGASSQDIVPTHSSTAAFPQQESPVTPESHVVVDMIDEPSEGMVTSFPPTSLFPNSKVEQEELSKYENSPRETGRENTVSTNDLSPQEDLRILDESARIHDAKRSRDLEEVPRFFDRFPIGLQSADELVSQKRSEIQEEGQRSFDPQLSPETEALQAWEMRLPIPSSNTRVPNNGPKQRIEGEAGLSSMVSDTRALPRSDFRVEPKREEEKPSFPDLVDEKFTQNFPFEIPQVPFPGFEGMAIPSQSHERKTQEELPTGLDSITLQFRDTKSMDVRMGEVVSDEVSGLDPAVPFTPGDESNVEHQKEQSLEKGHTLSSLGLPRTSSKKRSTTLKERAPGSTLLENREPEETSRQTEESSSLVHKSTSITKMQNTMKPGVEDSVPLPKQEETVVPQESSQTNLENYFEARLRSIAKVSISRELVSKSDPASTQANKKNRTVKTNERPDHTEIRQQPPDKLQKSLIHDKSQELALDRKELPLTIEADFKERDDAHPSSSGRFEAVKTEAIDRDLVGMVTREGDPATQQQLQKPKVMSTASGAKETELPRSDSPKEKGPVLGRSVPEKIGVRNEDSQQSLSQTTPLSARKFLGCQHGRAQLARHQYQEAILSFSESIQALRKRKMGHDSFVELQDCFRQRAYTYLQLNFPNQALSDIAYVLKRAKPDDLQWKYDMYFSGRLYVILHDSRQAIDTLTRSLDLGLEPKEQAYAYYLRGLSHLRLKQIEPGLQDVSRGCRQKFLEACQLLEQIF